MTISSTAAIGLISVAIGSTTVASLWRESGDSVQTAATVEQQLALWQCSPTRIQLSGLLQPSAAAPVEREAHVVCPSNYPPNPQTASVQSLFSALVR